MPPLIFRIDRSKMLDLSGQKVGDYSEHAVTPPPLSAIKIWL